MSNDRAISTLQAVERLRRIAAVAQGEDGDWLRDALHSYLEHAPDGVTLEDTLGLSCGRGATPWWRLERIRNRDAALRTAARMLAPDEPPVEQAERLLAEWRAYRRSAWRHDRASSTVPARIVGTARESLWHAERAAPLPDSARQLQRVLESVT